MRRAAAERQQTGVGERGVVDDDARTEAEGTKTASRLRPDHTANVEWDVADEDPIADLQIELRKQFGPHDDAVIEQQVVRVRSAGERQRSVEGELALHGTELHHACNRL